MIRRFWNSSTLTVEYTEQPALLTEANEVTGMLVGSKLANGKHAPVLDIDFAAQLIPSTTPNHWHLYLDGVELDDIEYGLLLATLQYVGIIQKGFARQFKDHGQTVVRRPHIKKVL